MKKIGIKLADGSFYPILDEGTPKKRMLDLTTVKDNQTKVQIDLYRSELSSMEDAEYVDTLEVTKLKPHPNGEPELHLSVGLDENNELTAEIVDPETGKKSETQVQLVSRTLAERDSAPIDYSLSDNESDSNSSDTMEEFSFDDFELPTDGESVTVGSQEEAPLEATAEETPAAEEPFSFDTEEEQKNPEEVSVDNILNQVDEAEPEVADFEYDEPDTESALAEEPVLEDISIPVSDETPAEETVAKETVVEEAASEEIALEETAGDDFNFDDIPVEEYVPETAQEETPAETEVVTEEISEMPAETEDAVAPAEDLAEDVSLAALTSDALADIPTESFEEAPSDSTENFSLDDMDIPVEEMTTEEPALEETVQEESFTEETVADLDSSDDLSSLGGLDLSDLDNFDAPAEETAATETSDFDMPDFDAPAEETATTETSDFDLPDFDAPAEEAATTETSDFDLPDFDAPAEETATTETSDFDMPDFDAPAEETAAETKDFSSFDISDSATDDTITGDFDLPDFDSFGSEDSSDSLKTETEGLSGYFDDPTFSDPVFTEDNLDSSTSSSSSMDFTDLYDKETIAGEHATPYTEDEEANSKRKTSVIICIVCAIICIIATLLVLFVIPSKYNLLTKNQTTETKVENTSTEKVTEETIRERELPPAPVTPKEEVKEVTPAPVETPKAPAAQVDKIVISPTPEVVPVPTPAPSAKSEDIRYKIKWGDTLWDIASSFYKNPFKYKNIATYNKIKNPDVIISGTYINIPAEN